MPKNRLLIPLPYMYIWLSLTISALTVFAGDPVHSADGSINWSAVNDYNKRKRDAYAPNYDLAQAFDLTDYEGKWLSQIKGPGRYTLTSTLGQAPHGVVYKIRITDALRNRPVHLWFEFQVVDGNSQSLWPGFFTAQDWEKSIPGPGLFWPNDIDVLRLSKVDTLYVYVGYRGPDVGPVVTYNLRWFTKEVAQAQVNSGQPQASPSSTPRPVGGPNR